MFVAPSIFWQLAFVPPVSFTGCGATLPHPLPALHRLSLFRNEVLCNLRTQEWSDEQTRHKPLETRELQAAAAALGLHLLLLNASTPREIEAAFANLVTQRADAFLLGTDPLFITTRDQVVALANRYAVPAIYPFREDVEAGGLASYGGSNRDGYHLMGGYAGRILSGEKPGDLPVQQATRLEMALNLKTAKALGLTIPLPLLGRADEVIE